jgi:hypothetical protein
MKSRPIKEQRLDDLESDFRPLLVSCLEECADGRWGLFGQNDHPEIARYFQWDEVERLKEIAFEIRALRAEFGQPNSLVERFCTSVQCAAHMFPANPS